MATEFGLLISLCGLSNQEVAELLRVRLDTVKSWSSGRRTAPRGAATTLVSLWSRIDTAAEKAAALAIERMETEGETPECIELGVAVDDADAQQVGWPYASVHERVVALVIARLLEADDSLNIAIMPRGTTTATAAAADQHT